MGRPTIRVPALIAIAAVALDCATLNPIASGACGNGVVDSATEDCDSFPSTCGKATDGAKACRLTCDRTQVGSCPSGWGCSVEGFCRQATGDLTQAGSPLSAGAAQLITGDFDGDGRVDIVGAPPYSSGGGSRVHYFDNNASLATTASLSVPIYLSVIKDFNHDGIDDLGFAITGAGVGGFAAMAGRRDRSFSPILFPAITLPKLVGVPTTISGTDRTLLPGLNRSCTIAVTQSDKGNQLRSFCGDTVGGAAELAITVPAAPADLIGPPKTGIIFNQYPGGSLSICGEVVMAYNDGAQGKLHIVSPCAVDVADKLVKWTTPADVAAKDITLPGKLLEPPFIGDFTDDGFDDVVVHTDSGFYLATSEKTGLGTFSDFIYRGVEIKAVPLAIGDLNNDTAVDIVLPVGVAMTVRANGDGGALPFTLSDTLSPTPRDGEQWSDVRIGNFNGDAIPDLLVSYQDSLDVEILGNGGAGLFTSYVVRSDQPVRTIIDGDFDGDLIRDVAFLQSPRAFDDPSGSGDVELVLAYGKTSGGPETPLVVGRFANARAANAIHDYSSTVDNLAVMEQIPSGKADEAPTTSITVIFGSGGRQTIAPLFMRDDDAKPPFDAKKTPDGHGRTRVWAPVAMAAGALGTPNTIDVFAIATGITIDFSQSTGPVLLRPFPTGVWIAPHDDAAVGGLSSFFEQQRITDVIAGIDAQKAQLSLLESSVISVVGDIDVPPNGLDEVISVARSPANQTGVFVVRPPDQAAPKASVMLPNVNVVGGDPIALVDVNADNAPDLVFLSTAGSKRNVFVILNDGKGGFVETPITINIPSVAASTGTTTPPTTTAAISTEDPIGFDHIVTGLATNGTNSQTELVIITETRLFLAKINPDNASFDVVDHSGNLVSDSKSVIRMTAVAGGDFDGDGVQDIAIADSGSIRILRQVPRLK